jgi:hypothetical protein
MLAPVRVNCRHANQVNRVGVDIRRRTPWPLITVGR